MFSTITLMTIIYFIVSVIYFQLAAHLLYEDKNSVVNRIFSLSMLALSVWSACLAIVSTTPSIEIAMQFKRISAFAWSFFFALFLNSVILLTDKKSIIESMFVKHLLYLPAIITCYAFSISNTTTKIVYQLTPIWYGWKNNAPNTIWLHIFNFYFISYLFFSLLLLLQWKNRTIFAAQKKVAKIIVASYGLAFIICTITDIILPRFTGVVAPDTACILAIMPTAAIFYAIKKFKLTTITHTNLANDILRNINECFFYLISTALSRKPMTQL